MKNNFSKIFWGFILVLVEFHFVAIDVLPDPLGYFFIYVGVHALSKNHAIGKKASFLALLLVFISLPTIFIQNSQVSEVGHSAPFDMLAIYMLAIGLIKLVLVLFVFKLMISICDERGNEALAKRTSSTFRIYMIVMLISSFLQTFFINISGDFLMGLMILLIISSMIMEITFLVLLRKFRKLDDIDLTI